VFSVFVFFVSYCFRVSYISLILRAELGLLVQAVVHCLAWCPAVWTVWRVNWLTDGLGSVCWRSERVVGRVLGRHWHYTASLSLSRSSFTDSTSLHLHHHHRRPRRWRHVIHVGSSWDSSSSLRRSVFAS